MNELIKKIGSGRMIKLELSVIPPSVNTLWVNKQRGRFKSKRGKEFEETAIYELKNQYKGIGIELKKEYINIAKQRIKNDLFNEIEIR